MTDSIGEWGGHDSEPVVEKVEEKYKPAVPQLFDFLNSITSEKNELIRDQDLSMSQLEKSYPAFAVNRGLSMGADTILMANQMNLLYGLFNDAQYRYFFNSVRKSKRRNTWAKSQEKDDLNLVAKHYQCNKNIARQYLKILKSEDLEKIRERYEVGGSTKTKKKKKKD